MTFACNIVLPSWASLVDDRYFLCVCCIQAASVFALAVIVDRRCAFTKRWLRLLITGLPLIGVAMLNILLNVLGFLWLLGRMAQAHQGQSAPFW